MSAYAADALVVLGLTVITLGVVGLFRMRDVYGQLHAAAKAVFLGLILLIVASLATGDAAIATRGLLIAVFLILTTPVGAHVIARAAYNRGECMRDTGAIDESGSGLADSQAPTPAEELGGPGAPRRRLE